MCTLNANTAVVAAAVFVVIIVKIEYFLCSARVNVFPIYRVPVLVFFFLVVDANRSRISRIHSHLGLPRPLDPFWERVCCAAERNDSIDIPFDLPTFGALMQRNDEKIVFICTSPKINCANRSPRSKTLAATTAHAMQRFSVAVGRIASNTQTTE